jgi:hypothetical protein
LDDIGLTSAAGGVARLTVGASLLTAIEASTHVRCSASRLEGAATLRLENCDGAAMAADDAIVAAAAGAGIKVQAEPSAISISFPR